MEHTQLDTWADGIDQLDALSNAALVPLFECIVAMDRAEAWRVDGAPSMAAWLTVRRGMSYFTASEHVRVAHALEDLPRIKAVFSDGRLHLDQLRAVTKIATAETDAYWAEEAPKHAATGLARMARNAREKTVDEARDAHENRSLRMRWDPDGNLRIVAHLPGDAGAVVQKAVERSVDQAPHDQKAREPLSALRADALVAIASNALAQDPDTDRATVVLHVDARKNGTGAVLLDGGPPVAVETAQRLMCDARIQAAAYDANQPIALGRTMRNVPARVARVIRFRDGEMCRFPGCGRTRRLAYHHQKPWSRGGRTDPSNVFLICVPHHWNVHEGGWTVEGDPNGELRFYDAHGHLYQPAPCPLHPEIRDRIVGPAPDPPREAPPEEPPLADTS